MPPTMKVRIFPTVPVTGVSSSKTNVFGTQVPDGVGLGAGVAIGGFVGLSVTGGNKCGAEGGNPPPLSVITADPLFWSGEKKFSSPSMNCRSFGAERQVSVVF